MALLVPNLAQARRAFWLILYGWVAWGASVTCNFQLKCWLLSTFATINQTLCFNINCLLSIQQLGETGSSIQMVWKVFPGFKYIKKTKVLMIYFRKMWHLKNTSSCSLLAFYSLLNSSYLLLNVCRDFKWNVILTIFLAA